MELSIITINLNNKAGLEKTIKSVISQSFKDFEYIIIDGGSTDGSREIIKQYSNYINLWVSEPDDGIYNGLNKGIRKAIGKYVLFLNSGDYLIHNTILFEVLKDEYKEDILYGDITYNDLQKNQTFTTSLPNKLDLYFFYKQSLWHQASFIKKALFDSVGLYNENNIFISDWEFFFDCIIFNQASYRKINLAITHYDMFNGISILRRKDSNSEKTRILKEKLTEPVFELLLKMDTMSSTLQDIYRSDSFKIQRWLNKHPIMSKLLIAISKIQFSKNK